VSSSKELTRRIDAMLARIERQGRQEQIQITTRWGNEEEPVEAGVIVIKTTWGTPRIGDRDDE
jgi:hypothetical protein